jgi:D-3-phosphoglycerate dehydrogenase
LDVLEYEKFDFENIASEELPKEWNELIKRENVLLSPHVAGWTSESYIKLSSYLAKKILSDWH